VCLWCIWWGLLVFVCSGFWVLGLACVGCVWLMWVLMRVLGCEDLLWVFFLVLMLDCYLFFVVGSDGFIFELGFFLVRLCLEVGD